VPCPANNYRGPSTDYMMTSLRGLEAEKGGGTRSRREKSRRGGGGGVEAPRWWRGMCRIGPP